MKQVYQTITDKGHGNCMQAAIASLLDKELNDVPNFKLDSDPIARMYDYLSELGYEPSYFENNQDIPSIEEILEFDGGVNGFFYAVVQSQTHIDDPKITHAVIVDKNLNIVHDPNPNGLALKLQPSDVIRVLTLDQWYIDLNGKLTRELQVTSQNFMKS